MVNLTDTFVQLKALVTELEASGDVAKAQDGVNAAGTRVRNAMQEIKEVSQTLRTAVLDVRKAKEVKA